MGKVQQQELLGALPFPVLLAVAACSAGSNESAGLTFVEEPPAESGAMGGTGGTVAAGATGGSMTTAGTGGTGTVIDVVDQQPMCPAISCAALGYACGSLRDECGKIINCADEGLTCGALEACTGGVDAPTVCATAGGDDCTACAGVPNCSKAAQLTQLGGRVITPGRDDANAGNQVGVPNAFVYILRTDKEADLPPFTSGIPDGGTSCDRCQDQDLGPVLVGALTDATGRFTLEGNIPVGMEFTLVVKVGRFRRATRFTLPEDAACATTTLPTSLPENPTRLPRNMADGIAVNIPRIAVSTGEADAIECVLHKMGLATAEFGNPGADGSAAERVHLYRGGQPPGTATDPITALLIGPSGARIDDQTPHDRELYADRLRLQSYDIVIADCEGLRYDSDGADRTAGGDFVREYVNRGGRLFASHLEFTWLDANGTTPYAAADPIATGLAPAGTWTTVIDLANDGKGAVSVGRPQASPRIQNFADWMESEGVIQAGMNTFEIIEPRSQNVSIGASVEEFVYETQPVPNRVEQFSVNTPYGAPKDAICGRVAYSGFHVAAAQNSGVVSASPNANAIFPQHCRGDLSAQEKVLLYMLFDLNACVGDTPPPPECTPESCASLEVECGFTPDGCGTVLDCGPCPVMQPR